MSEGGFTRSFRRKWRNPVFRNLRDGGIWSYLCDNAAWRETAVRFGDRLVTLKRGQIATSERFLAEGFCCDRQVVRRLMDDLVKAGMVRRETIRGGSLLTIVKYDEYQASAGSEIEPSENPTPTHQQTQQATHPSPSATTEIPGRHGDENPPPPSGDTAANPNKKEGTKEEESSVAKATGADAPEDLRSMVFGSVLRWWMKATGDEDKPARAFLAKQCRDFNNGAVVLAVAALQSRPPPLFEPKSALVDELKRIVSNAPTSRPTKETADERAHRRRAGLAAAVMAGDMGSSGAGAGFGGLDLAGDGGGGTVIDASEPEIRRGDAGPDPRATRAA